MKLPASLVRIALTLAAAVVLLFVFQLFRWQIVPGENFTIYRLDRLTGRVEMSMGGMEWLQIANPEPARTTFDPSTAVLVN